MKILLVALLIAACAGCAARPVAPGAIVPDAPVRGYALAWHDEFDGTALDGTRWVHHHPGPHRNAVNVPEAVTLDGAGHLLITTTRHEVRLDPATTTTEFRTGMISTRGRYETTYGYFECRMRMQTQLGHWSAFWINTPTMGRPEGDPARAGVEIDVIEYLKSEDYSDKANHTIHWDYKTPSYKRDFTRVTMPEIASGFHTFGCEWTPEAIIFFVDGRETWRTSKAVPARDQYMLLSVEAGKWAGDIRAAALPDGIAVDYVRVFKKVPTP